MEDQTCSHSLGLGEWGARFRRMLALFLLPALLIATGVLGQTAKPAQQSTSLSTHTQTAPSAVETGIYISQISNVSLKDNKFTVDMYVWFRYTNALLKPLETFEVVGGKIESKTGLTRRTINGVIYDAARVIVTINKFWDVSRYPLDKHVLSIDLEDTDSDKAKLVYVVDHKNTGMSPDAQVRGWSIHSTVAKTYEHVYNTNYGDISLPPNNESGYSRFSYQIEVIRPSVGQFFKLFAIMFLAAFVAFLAFFIAPTVGPRFGLGTGALFASAANSFVIGASLPESVSITLADRLQLLTVVTIALSLVVSTFSLKCHNSGHEARSILIDKCARYLVPPLYVALVAVFVVWR